MAGAKVRNYFESCKSLATLSIPISYNSGTLFVVLRPLLFVTIRYDNTLIVHAYLGMSETASMAAGNLPFVFIDNLFEYFDV